MKSCRLDPHRGIATSQTHLQGASPIAEAVAAAQDEVEPRVLGTVPARLSHSTTKAGDMYHSVALGKTF